MIAHYLTPRVRKLYVAGLRVVMVGMHSAMFAIGHAHVPTELSAGVTLVWMLEELAELTGGGHA